jgi:uncharacterized membrane protein
VGIALTLHFLASTIWVGGMFFAYMALRPVAADLLEPPLRLRLWSRVFQRFFPWVWASVIVLVSTGFWIIFAAYGGMGAVGPQVHLMLLLGLVMSGIFAYIWFGPYTGLRAAVAAEDWPTGSARLATIRRLIGTNLTLGLLVIVIAVLGRWMV